MEILDMARDTITNALRDRKIPDSVCLKACEINPSFLAEWRKGKLKSPGFDKVYRIFKYLGISIDGLEDSKQTGTGPSAVNDQEADPFCATACDGLAQDEAEIMRLYQMQDIEGRTEILHTAYEQKRRLAVESEADRGCLMAETAKQMMDEQKNEKGNGA